MSILRKPVSSQKAALARQLRREMTNAERLLWERLRANRLGGVHFRRQQVIEGFIVDFYCHAARLVIEVDGLVHKFHVHDDAERERILQEYGCKVIRVTNDEVNQDLDAVVKRIMESVGKKSK